MARKAKTACIYQILRSETGQFVDAKHNYKPEPEHA